MEQQATEILELIKNGMAEMPQIGSDAWNLYISGVRASGIISIVTYLVIIIVMLLACYVTVRISADNYDPYNITLLDILLIIFGIISLMVGFFFIIELSTNLTQIITPEYYIIENIIRTLH